MTTTDSAPRLKHRPEDFLVRENLLLPLTERDGAGHQYLLLRKSGYTTFEAIRLLAGHFDCPSRDIGYAGLKDEDGITEQLVAVPLGVRGAPGDGGVLDLSDPDGGPRRLTVRHYGWGAAPIEIGRLEGNSFRVVVRNLAPEVAGRLAELRRVSFCALNYYDTQRFGVPGGPKLTHLLGGRILAGDWPAALDLMRQLKAPESRFAEQWPGGAQEFFTEGLERRVVNFYLSAWASHQWNAELAELAAEFGAESYVETVDGIDYRYLTSSAAAARLLGRRPELPYRRLTFNDEKPEGSSPRPTVVQVPLLVEAVAPDDAHPGRSSAALRFALTSGCYATAVVRQLLTPLVGAAH